MRATKEVKIDDRRITVFELSVNQIKKVWQDLATVGEPQASTDTDNKDADPTFTFIGDDFLKKNWADCVAGITLDEIGDLTPSELAPIYNSFQEVNQAFFDLAQRVEGENPFIVTTRKIITGELILRFAGLSKRDTLTPGDTDTPSS